jgi:glycosyltransferase involved in cell wall biosynthesis
MDRAATPELSLIVPIFNEQKIALCIERVSTELTLIDLSYEIMAVDNGSSDRSFAILRELAGRDHSYEWCGCGATLARRRHLRRAFCAR